MVDDTGGPGTPTTRKSRSTADYDLNYDYVMRAITAITGYIENGQPHKLIETHQIHAAEDKQGVRSRSGEQNRLILLPAPCSLLLAPCIRLIAPAPASSRPRMKRVWTFFSREWSTCV